MVRMGSPGNGLTLHSPLGIGHPKVVSSVPVALRTYRPPILPAGERLGEPRAEEHASSIQQKFVNRLPFLYGTLMDSR
jgi:hypothetical protein